MEYTRWRNPKGAEKIDDSDLLAVLIITLLSPLMVVAIWLYSIFKSGEYITPFAAVVYVYTMIKGFWKEVL